MAASGVEAQIYSALMDAVVALAQSLKVALASPNVAFTPPIAVADGQGFKKGDRLPYLVASYMPNTADVFGYEYDSDVDYQGMLQVSVFWPARAGIVKPLQVAAQIVAAFKPGTKIDASGLRIRIDQQPTVAPALTESDLVQIPVTVRWRVFVPAAA